MKSVHLHADIHTIALIPWIRCNKMVWMLECLLNMPTNQHLPSLFQNWPISDHLWHSSASTGSHCIRTCADHKLIKFTLVPSAYNTVKWLAKNSLSILLSPCSCLVQNLMHAKWKLASQMFRRSCRQLISRQDRKPMIRAQADMNKSVQWLFLQGMSCVCPPLTS